MSNDLAIMGDFTDFRNVKTRKALQLVIEVPIERTEHVLKTLGVPNPNTNIYVAVARLTDEAVEQALKPKQKNGKYTPLATKIALKCQEPLFITFLKEKKDRDVQTEAEAAEYVRTFCGVDSRSKIEHNEQALSQWQNLYGQYDAWRMVE